MSGVNRVPTGVIGIGGEPSRVTDRPWVFARRRTGDYPAAGDRSGKWLIFVPAADVDVVWERVRAATVAGLLGHSAKAATAMPSPLATAPDRRVICVYTYDWTDAADVRRVREQLRALGFVGRLPYKADADTRAGRYGGGGGRVSRYYE